MTAEAGATLKAEAGALFDVVDECGRESTQEQGSSAHCTAIASAATFADAQDASVSASACAIVT
jgi:hypothetical protein